MTAHMVQAALEYANVTNQTAAVVFVDEEKACHRVLRPLLFGGELPESIPRTQRRAQMPCSWQRACSCQRGCSCQRWCSLQRRCSWRMQRYWPSRWYHEAAEDS